VLSTLSLHDALPISVCCRLGLDVSLGVPLRVDSAIRGEVYPPVSPDSYRLRRGNRDFLNLFHNISGDTSWTANYSSQVECLGFRSEEHTSELQSRSD